jgi:hypothetical protein
MDEHEGDIAKTEQEGCEATTMGWKCYKRVVGTYKVVGPSSVVSPVEVATRLCRGHLQWARDRRLLIERISGDPASDLELEGALSGNFSKQTPVVPIRPETGTGQVLDSARGKEGCCADGSCTPDTCMDLPLGKTCGDCVHRNRCISMYGADEAQTHCGFFPRRFREAPKLYYVEDSRYPVGNCVSWWAKNGAGYTCHLDKAHVFTADEIRRRGATRETDIPWPKEAVDEAASLQVDSQRLPFRPASWSATGSRPARAELPTIANDEETR